jgi:serine/threonine protein kinase
MVMLLPTCLNIQTRTAISWYVVQVKSSCLCSGKAQLHEAALGLVYLHRHSVIHGDIKASNILVDEHGVACLADFGLSQIKTSTTTLRTAPTSVSSILGTARWAAPEQMTLGVLSRATDVYSLGMAMFEVFAGAPPFAHTPDALLFAVVDCGLRPPRPEGAEQQGLDDATWALVERCWNQAPAERPTAPQTATALKDLIDNRDDRKQQASSALAPDAGPALDKDDATLELSSPYGTPCE